jgi:hypothetical protein
MSAVCCKRCIPRITSVRFVGIPRLGCVYPETGKIGLFFADYGDKLTLIFSGTSIPQTQSIIPLSG